MQHQRVDLVSILQQTILRPRQIGVRIVHFVNKEENVGHKDNAIIRGIERRHLFFLLSFSCLV